MNCYVPSVKTVFACSGTIGWTTILVLAMAYGPQPTYASDHADPLFNNRQEAGITDLFGFVSEEEQILTLIVCVRRALTDTGPIPLEPYTYNIFIDLDSEVSFDNRLGTLARYGGRVVNPRSIFEEISIALRLHNQPRPVKQPQTESSNDLFRQSMLRNVNCSGIDEESIQIWAGVRDDPFIFHRFARTNCVAMVLDIPLNQFPSHQQDFLIWATTHKGSQQIDHVGRSLRTMLPRLDFLNKLHPREHLDALHARDEAPGLVADVSRFAIPPLFGLRSYDFEPDVMILTRRTDVTLNGMPYPTSYPNGRRLEDDVAKLCCEQGDCLLYEVSLAEAHHDGKPRPTKNSEPFSEDFPYLVEPIERAVAVEDPSLTRRTILWLVFAGLVLTSILAYLIYSTFRYVRLKRAIRLGLP